jgi:hypothetical protein
MNKSESIVKLSQAMAKAQAEVNHALLDSKNPHFRSDYASLESCLNAAKPVMGKYGLALMQSGDRSAEGDIVLTSLLTHESGEWVQFQMPLVLSKQDMQGLGSSLTYGRRYALCGLFGIGSDDDDGNAASIKPQTQPTPQQQRPAQQTQSGGPLASRKQMGKAFAMYTAAGLNKESFGQWLAERTNGGQYSWKTDKTTITASQIDAVIKELEVSTGPQRDPDDLGF